MVREIVSRMSSKENSPELPGSPEDAANQIGRDLGLEMTTDGVGIAGLANGATRSLQRNGRGRH